MLKFEELKSFNKLIINYIKIGFKFLICCISNVFLAETDVKRIFCLKYILYELLFYFFMTFSKNISSSHILTKKKNFCVLLYEKSKIKKRVSTTLLRNVGGRTLILILSTGASHKRDLDLNAWPRVQVKVSSERKKTLCPPSD